MSGSPILSARHSSEKHYLMNLNERFRNYADKVKLMQEKCKKTENNIVLAQFQSWENEMEEVKKIHENEIEKLRNQIDDLTAERNDLLLSTKKNAVRGKSTEEKYQEEVTNRKKLENALADSHRLLSEKDSLIQELRIAIAQHQNAYLDISKEKEDIQSHLSTVVVKCDQEMKEKSDLEANLRQLTDKIEFEHSLYEKDMKDYQSKLAAAECALQIADEKLREHDLVDESLHAKVENMCYQAQSEMKHFRQSTESEFKLQLQEQKAITDKKTTELSQKNEKVIELQSVIEEMSVKISKMESRNSVIQQQNRHFIHSLESERRTSATNIHKLEEKLRDLQENLNSKIRELNVANNHNIPVDIEIEAFGKMLEAEERRLALALENPPSELLLSSRGELISARTQHSQRSLPTSPRQLQLINRSKSSTNGLNDKERSDAPKQNGYLPAIDSSRVANQSNSGNYYSHATGLYYRSTEN